MTNGTFLRQPPPQLCKAGQRNQNEESKLGCALEGESSVKPQFSAFTHLPTCMVISMANSLGVSCTERLREAEKIIHRKPFPTPLPLPNQAI